MKDKSTIDQLKQPFFNPVPYSFVKSLFIILAYFGLRMVGSQYLLSLAMTRRPQPSTVPTFEELVGIQTEVEIEMFVLQLSLLMMLVLLLYLFGYKPNLFSEGSVSKSKFKLSLKIYVIMWLSLTLFNLAVSVLMPHYTQPANQQVIEVLVSQQNTLIMFVTLVIIAPIAEELIFRGLIMRGMFPKYPFVGFAVSATFFTLAHSPANAIDFMTYFILSVGLTYIYWRTREIKYPIMIHMIQNFLSFIIMVFV